MKDNIKVAISSDFLTAFARLPRQVQGKVTEFVNKFRNNPMSPGINYEKLNSGIDKKIFSVRIDDTYRGIVVRQQEAGVYLLLWVDHHDEAYQWAARKRCEVNPKTGAIQVFDVQTVVEQISTPEKVALFALAKDDDLLRLGVPEVQLDLVRSFVNKEDFYKSESAMPHDVYEHLSWLVEGFPMEEVLELVSEEQNSSAFSEDLAAALDVPTTLKSFVVVDGEDELRRIMAEPLEKWRVFLHPTQRKIVQKEYSGSARVLGGAGTGKTVVAMHRAKHLASKCEGQQRILMTTFTANLAADIREKQHIIENTLAGNSKGGIFECAVADALHKKGYQLYFYKNETTKKEIDVIIQKDGKVVPIEVKSGNTRANSLKSIMKNNKDISYGYKFIDGNIGTSEEGIITLPLYMIAFFDKVSE